MECNLKHFYLAIGLQKHPFLEGSIPQITSFTCYKRSESIRGGAATCCFLIRVFNPLFTHYTKPSNGRPEPANDVSTRPTESLCKNSFWSICVAAMDKRSSSTVSSSMEGKASKVCRLCQDSICVRRFDRAEIAPACCWHLSVSVSGSGLFFF